MVQNHIICRTSYPLYSISLVGHDHVTIAGGGGTSKTGVPNRIEIFYLDIDEDGIFSLTKSSILDTTLAPMCLDIAILSTSNEELSEKIAPVMMATGQDRYCKLYAMNGDLVVIQNDQILPYNAVIPKLRRRPTENGPDLQNGLVSGASLPKPCLGFSLREYKSIQTDSHPNFPYQKVVRFSPDGTHFITGGADGHFRVWDLLSGRKIVDHNAHKDEVVDIAVSPDGKRFISIGRDYKGFVWTIADGSKVCELNNPPPGVPDRYRFRAAKFSKVAGTDIPFFLAFIPINVRIEDSYLTRWSLSPTGAHCLKSVVIPRATVSVMAVSEDAKFVGIGDQNGSVYIYDSVKLSLVRKFGLVHSSFITGLEFLPAKPRVGSKLQVGTSDFECSLLSISVDQTVQLHALPRQPGPNFLWKMVMVCFVSCLFAILFGLLEL